MPECAELASEVVAGQVSGYKSLRAALETLSDGIVAPVRADVQAWSARLKQAVTVAESAFRDHCAAAESAEGTLADISARRPRLIARVERQREDHREILIDASGLEQEIDRQQAFQDVAADQLRLRAAILHDKIRLHMALGGDLLYEAYFRDLGGEGG